MMTDDEIAGLRGWLICWRHPASPERWQALTEHPAKAVANERCDELALEDPAREYAIFRLHIVVRGVVHVHRYGDD